MKWALPLLCLLCAAGLWGWALLAPKEAEIAPLPARFAGTFEFVHYEAPQGRAVDNPLPPGLRHAYTFRTDGTYLFSVFVSGGYEILREEGVAEVGPSGVMTLTRISRNRREERAPPERFYAEWGEDEGGAFLALRHVALGYTLRFRPQKAE